MADCRRLLRRRLDRFGGLFGDAALGAASSRRSDSALGGGRGHHPAGTVAVQYGRCAGPRPEYGPRRRRNPPVVQVAPFSDPGEAIRHAAQDTLDRARAQLADAGDRAAESIQAHTEGAPEESGWLDDLGGFLGDVGEGAWDSISGFGETLWDIIPIQAIWDPQGYTDGLVTIAQGIAHNVTHPVDFLKGLVAWDTWSESPGRAIGEILGGAVLGGGIARVAGKLGKVDGDGDTPDSDGDADTTEPDTPPEPDSGTPRTPEEHRTDLGTDPATGSFRPGEAETGLRIEEQRGVTLERAPAPQGADWVGSDGKAYDAVGNFPARFFDQQWEQLQFRIQDHLNKADYVPVDVSQFTPEQVARIREFVEPLGPRVFIVGE